MEQQTHKRRVRYKGTHPRTYQEKYKELNPEKYKDTIEHVIQKGNTPAGMHISICVKEILNFLQIRPGQTGLDATLGYGGHSTEMLKCLESRGHLYALDVDPIEIEKTKRRLAERGFAEDILSIKQMNFANVKELLPESGKESLQCRSITRSGDFPINLTDHWICALIRKKEFRQVSACVR